VASPKDFGFYGRGEGAGEGRYTPLRSAASHERFRADLARMIDLIAAGRSAEARAGAASPDSKEITALPAFHVADLDGRSLRGDGFAGRAVIVEFWATWCPPCRGTLNWLGTIQQRFGGRVTVIAIAVESDESAVRDLTAQLGLPIRWAMGRPDLVRAFGDLSAVPTLFLFDPAGHTSGVFYGATPTLHEEVESRLERLLTQG